MSFKPFTHGLVAVDKTDMVLHFVGFWDKPSDIDFNHIEEELENDPEFELPKGEYTITTATLETVAFFNQQINEGNVDFWGNEDIPLGPKK